jgi:hypothetical protein
MRRRTSRGPAQPVPDSRVLYERKGCGGHERGISGVDVGIDLGTHTIASFLGAFDTVSLSDRSATRRVLTRWIDAGTLVPASKKLCPVLGFCF